MPDKEIYTRLLELPPAKCSSEIIQEHYNRYREKRLFCLSHNATYKKKRGSMTIVEHVTHDLEKILQEEIRAQIRHKEAETLPSSTHKKAPPVVSGGGMFGCNSKPMQMNKESARRSPINDGTMPLP